MRGKANHIPSIYNSLSDEEKDQTEEEYEELLPLFVSLVRSLSDKEKKKEALTELARLRTKIATIHAFDGFGMEYEEAIALIQQTDGLTELEEEKKKRLVAAVNNLIEFCVCAEYQLMCDVYEELPDFDFDNVEYGINEDDDDDPLILLCRKYNKTYLGVENTDIDYAMAIALAWVIAEKHQTLTYMTQNDDRVRPWHFALQGFTAPKDDFPSWMIPPIEWGCRCFLVNYFGDTIVNSSDIKKVSAKYEKPSQIDDVFSESVAKCGRIFGKSHSYFKVGDKDKEILKSIVESIREDYYGKKD